MSACFTLTCSLSELKLYLLACSETYLDSATKIAIYFFRHFLALGYEYRCQKPLNLKSFQTYSGQCGASQHQQVKFIRPYLDLGIVPIKQNRAVEQQSNGPLGIRPNALRLKFMLL